MNKIFHRLGLVVAMLAGTFIWCGARESQTERVMREGAPMVQRGDYATAVDIYSRLKTIYEQGERSPKIALGLQYAANCYAFSHRYIEALEYYVLANKAASETNRPDVGRGCLNNIGLIYAIFKDYERAAHYFGIAFSQAMHENDTTLASTALINIINCYCYLGNVQEAKKWLNLRRRFPFAKSEDDLFHTLFSSGLIAGAENDFAHSVEYLRSALALDSITPVTKTFAADAMLQLGFAYQNLGRPDSATHFYRRAAYLALHDDNPAQLADAWRYLASLYSVTGLSDSAAYYSHKWITLNDSIFNTRAFNHAKEKLVIYENSITEKKFGHLNTRIRGQNRIIFFILIALIFVAGVSLSIAVGRRKLRLAQKLLINKNEDLMRQNERLNQINEEFTKSVKAANEHSDKNEAPDIAKEAYTLTSVQRENLLAAIEGMMRRTEVITDSTLNINSLAKMIGSNAKYVSQIINDTYGKNFKTFLNEYRIREACSHMMDDEYMEKHTLAALASDVGFVSVNTFTVAFKKVMGMTPSVYRKLAGSRP